MTNAERQTSIDSCMWPIKNHQWAWHHICGLCEEAGRANLHSSTFRNFLPVRQECLSVQCSATTKKSSTIKFMCTMQTSDTKRPPKRASVAKRLKIPGQLFVLLLFELHHFEIWLEETYCAIAVCLFSVQGRFTSTAPYLCWYVDTTWHTLGLTLNSVTKHSVFLLSFSIDVHFYFHCLLTIVLACRCSGGEPVFYVEQNVLQIKWFLGLMKISKRHYWFWHNML